MGKHETHAAGAAQQTPASGPPRGRILGLVLGLTAAVALMLLALVLPAAHSGPDHLPIAISGPQGAQRDVADTLEATHPGAFDIVSKADADDIAAAIKDRSVVGGLAVTRSGVTVQTASAAGAPYVTLLHSIGTAMTDKGQKVTYADVVPYPGGDPAGSGLTALGLPLVFGGMASAVTLSTLLKRRWWLRVVASIGFSVIAGLAVTAILQFWIGTLEGNYWEAALTMILGIAAISLTVLGLESLFGYAGLLLGAMVMLFVSNPLSGIATGSQWLPHPWGTVGQWLPIGATGNAMRGVGFFDGALAGGSLLVLLGWIVFGMALTTIAHLRHVRARQQATVIGAEPELLAV
ncbi:ABC transporter permease [Branchiibius cervicis]|uniref:ABC transporter permease n=1 Tax=Branchiibius cervicis TaxID=908252 RepID=A0ABW2AU54_9MICO